MSLCVSLCVCVFVCAFVCLFVCVCSFVRVFCSRRLFSWPLVCLCVRMSVCSCVLRVRVSLPVCLFEGARVRLCALAVCCVLN